MTRPLLRRWIGRATAMFDGVRCHLGTVRTPSASADRRETLRRLALFPAGDQDVASARLRALPLLTLMEPASLRSVRVAAPLHDESPDVAWIQKRLTPHHLRLAQALKARGGLVVYDCDESGPDLSPWARPALVKEMLLLADVVTTDTAERAELLKEIVASSRTKVLENQIDYADQLRAAASPRVRVDSGELRVLWFGFGENLRALGAYVDVLYSLGGVRIVLCGPRRSEVRSVFGHLPVEVHRWSRAGFVEVIGSCDVTILSHFGSRHDAAKSAHKMVTSICHGVPALVSDTPDYGRVAALAGVREGAVFASPEELGRLLGRMKSVEVRQAYIDQARPRVMGRYGAGTFAEHARILLNDLFLRSPRSDPPKGTSIVDI